jgi:Flp pilus assembly protein TadG
MRWSAPIQKHLPRSAATSEPQRSIVSFLRREEGSVAITFGLALLPVLAFAGIAVDYSRATQVRTRLQAATDAIVLQLCQAKATVSVQEMKNQAQATLNSFFPGGGATVDAPVVVEKPRQISLKTHIVQKAMFTGLIGKSTIPLSTSAECEAPERFFEIALSLDTTGSMDKSDGTMKKIDALKKASADFVGYMFDTPALADRTKISLVPFSAAVTVNPSEFRSATWIDQNGQSSLHWQNVSDAAGSGFGNRLAIFAKLRATALHWDWAGCFEALPYPLNVQDGKPAPGNPDSYYVPMFAPDEAGNGGSTSHTETSSGKTQYTPNSYINDKNSEAGCTTTPADDRTRTARACKYKKPEGVSTSNDRGPNYMCRSRPMTRLTADKSKLLNEINALQANGNTNIHEGAMWGWRSLSPNSVFADGVAYSQRDTTKVLVLMTDGMNTWTHNSGNTVLRSLYSAYGYFVNADGSKPNARLAPANANPATEAQARAAMDELTRQACRNAAQAGVVVYTIGFSIQNDPIDAQGLQLLRDCAGSSDRTYVANNANDLIKVFKEIAQGIGKLRIRR